MQQKPTLALVTLAIAALALPLLADAAPPLHEHARFALGGDGGWDYLTVDAAARRMYVARANRVMVIDADAGTLLGEVPGLDGAHGVVPVAAQASGYATSGKTGELVAFRLQDRVVTGRVHVGENPDALLWEPLSQRLLVFNGKSQDVAVVDPVALAVEQTLTLGGKPEFAVSDGAGRVYVNIEDTSELVVLAVTPGKPLTVLARHPLAPCQEPTGLALGPHGKRLLVGCSNRTAVVVDAHSGKVLQHFTTGAGVDAAAWDLTRGRAYVSAREGILTVLQDRHGALAALADVKTVLGSRTLAVDAKSGAVYLPAAEFTTSQPPARPQVLPGSFLVLVLAP